jgi:thiol-disulfide isomerase/thioredoxin
VGRHIRALKYLSGRVNYKKETESQLFMLTTKPNVLMVTFLLGLSACEVRNTSAPQKPPAAGNQVVSPPAPQPQAAAVYLNGKGESRFSLDAYKGQVLVLDCWATWSAPCRDERPWLNGLAREWPEKKVSFLGMALDRGESAQITEAVKAFDIPYPVLWADDVMQRAIGGVRALPTKILVDKRGQIRKQLPGAISAESLRAEINSLLAEN